MKSIAVVAIEKEYASILRNYLEGYFSKYACFTEYALSEIENITEITEDFVVLATFTIFNRVDQKLKKGSEIIVVTTTPDKNSLVELEDVNNGTRALVVNYDYRTCIQTIINIYGAGINNLEMIPYFGEGDYDRSIKVAITPNESRLVPEGIERIIDIGESVVDYNSLFRIAEKLNVSETFSLNEGIEAKQIAYFSNLNMDRILGENLGFIEKINTIIKLFEMGVIITDVAGNILTFNDKSKKILVNNEELLKGFKIWDIVPCLFGLITKNGSEISFEDVIDINGKNVVITVTNIVRENKIYGRVITVDDFEKIEERQHGLRNKLVYSGNKAKHSFSDIIGVSKVIKDTIIVAKRMAKSESSIMITGESGTGKEIFAQSIHNESPRKNYNFVAVNCAAIPDNLLESEMFGYEEGSFTGAKKGGKIGYFELAHKGTIFLDEIAEMPLSLQSKLLRVIEERQITRVGSINPFSVDVRIICATNQNIYNLMEGKKFREDLYYRLNVLPLELPSLRERKEDIYPLIICFMKQLGCPMVFTEEARDFLLSHYWKGNIRELRNAVEFLSNSGSKTIELKHLHFLKKHVNGTENVNINKSTSDTCDKISVNREFEKRFILQSGGKLELIEFILQELIKAKNSKRKLSRKKLNIIADEMGLDYTEGEIRGAMSRLSEFRFVISGNGRNGTVITKEGEAFYDTVKEFV